ncbi:hypothetical protein Tco_1200850 [Tanacetum coccineum]
MSSLISGMNPFLFKIRADQVKDVVFLGQEALGKSFSKLATRVTYWGTLLVPNYTQENLRFRILWARLLQGSPWTLSPVVDICLLKFFIGYYKRENQEDTRMLRSKTAFHVGDRASRSSNQTEDFLRRKLKSLLSDHSNSLSKFFLMAPVELSQNYISGPNFKVNVSYQTLLLEGTYQPSCPGSPNVSPWTK